MRPFNNLENKIPSDTYCIEVHMYGSSDSLFFRTSTGIQFGSDAFNKSRLFMTFWNNLGVREILRSFRLLLEGKSVKDISESSRLELRKVFSKQFCCVRWRTQHLQAVEQRRYSRFTFVENTINSLEVVRAKFLGSDRFFYFISVSKFRSFKNPFAMQLV